MGKRNRSAQVKADEMPRDVTLPRKKQEMQDHDPLDGASNQAIQRSIKGKVTLRQSAPASMDAAEQEARRVADSIDPSVPSGAGTEPGLPKTLRQNVESKLAADISGVQIHDDEASHRLAQNMGANAVTLGSDVYFNENQYQPGTPQGNRLIAHELTHVHQQGQASPRPQFDLMQSLPSVLGVFEIEMSTMGPPNNVGMRGWIRFLPDSNGPYSAQIALIQIANLTDVAGTTAAAGSPVDWRNVGAGEESGRMDLMTPGSLTGARRGWFVDTRTDLLARGTSSEPVYLTPYGESAGNNEFGWLRSPTDLHLAMLWDYPQWNIDSDFDFETVAKGTDSQVIYGSLHWGFKVRSGRVQDEYVYTTDVQSAAFDEALERFRGYYAHEPVVIYFDTDQDVPVPGEEAKLADIPSYMSRYPDAQIDVTGFADERGDASHNLDLSLRRAERVHQLLENLGIDPGRLGFPIGHGETGQFAAGADAGTWHANRRVVIRFTRTASTPIRMP